MRRNAFIRWIVIFGVICGFYLVVRSMPEHKKIFWRNFLRQIPDLPGRYMA